MTTAAGTASATPRWSGIDPMARDRCIDLECAVHSIERTAPPLRVLDRIVRFGH